MKTLWTSCLALISSALWAQIDTDATQLLDQVAQKMQSSEAWKMDFTYIIENKKEISEHGQEGAITLKGDMYILDLMGNKYFFDGQKSYNYIKEYNEVNILPPEEGQESFFFSKPSKIFTFYNIGYKSKYLGETVKGDKKYLEVHLFPNELEKSFFKIEILVFPDSKKIRSIKVFNKDGINHQVILKNIEAIEIENSAFTFNPKDYPKVEVIDMTE
jgi:outer membrane lipoprotein carrier protein